MRSGRLLISGLGFIVLVLAALEAATTHSIEALHSKGIFSGADEFFVKGKSG